MKKKINHQNLPPFSYLTLIIISIVLIQLVLVLGESNFKVSGQVSYSDVGEEFLFENFNPSKSQSTVYNINGKDIFVKRHNKRDDKFQLCIVSCVYKESNELVDINGQPFKIEYYPYEDDDLNHRLKLVAQDLIDGGIQEDGSIIFPGTKTRYEIGDSINVEMRYVGNNNYRFFCMGGECGWKLRRYVAKTIGEEIIIGDSLYVLESFSTGVKLNFVTLLETCDDGTIVALGECNDDGGDEGGDEGGNGESCETITTLEIINDLSQARINELAFSGVPIAQSRNLKNTNNLYVISPSNQVIPAQFIPLSRWGSGPADLNAPIKWVEVAFKADVSSGSSNNLAKEDYLLVECQDPQQISDDEGILEISSIGQTSYSINTGAAEFIINGANPALFEEIIFNGVNILDKDNSGPKVMDGNGVELIPYISSLDEFEIEYQNEIQNHEKPVKVTVKRTGHFQGGTSCGTDLAYVSRFTFVRGSSDVLIDFDIVNECGDGWSVPFSDYFKVNVVRWDFAFTDSTKNVFAITEDGISRGSSSVKIEQHLGNQANPGGWRKASIMIDQELLLNKEFFEKSAVALETDTVTAMVQMPKMKYREPQALQVNQNKISFNFISEPRNIGEAQGVWNFGKLSLRSIGLTSQDLLQIQALGQRELERALLVHVPVTYMNELEDSNGDGQGGEGPMPRLPENFNSQSYQKYLSLLESVHRKTVNSGEQWDSNKNYGLFTWPDYQFDSWRNNLNSPDDYVPKSNYWDAASSELKQWFVDGNPKWVWDFSYWQGRHFASTITYNLGTRSSTAGSDVRSGFGVGEARLGGSSADGNRYRTGISSDDYFYNMHQDESYLIKPSGRYKDLFELGGNTFIRRYNVPSDQGRDHFLNSIRLDRGESQHYNTLRYAAEFVQDNNQQFQNKLNEVMSELVRDNLIGGMFCADDSGNEQSCTSGQMFMHSAIHNDFFRQYLRHWGDINGKILNSVGTFAKRYFDALPRVSDSSLLNVGVKWFRFMECSFSGDQITICNIYGSDGEGAFTQENPMHLSNMLIAHSFDPSIQLCVIAADGINRALDVGDFTSFFTRPGGWGKVSSQIIRDVVHGIGISEVCSTTPTTPTCSDGIQNQGETGVDCGGPNCSACSTTPTCSDGIQNGNEEGVDCGGSCSDSCRVTPPPLEDPQLRSLPGLPTSVFTPLEVINLNEPSPQSRNYRGMDPQYGHIYLGTDSCESYDEYYIYYASEGMNEYEFITTHTDNSRPDLLNILAASCGNFKYTFKLEDGDHQIAVCVRNSNGENYCVEAPFRLIGMDNGGVPDPTCTDGIQNQGETNVDCGGPNCSACAVTPTCTDGIQNQGETSVDCGGPNCSACVIPPTVNPELRILPGLPTSTYELRSGEFFFLREPGSTSRNYRTKDPQYGHVLLNPFLGQNAGCSSNDFINFDVYVASSSSSSYKLALQHGLGGREGNDGDLVWMQSNGCYGPYKYFFNLGDGDHQVAVCTTNTLTNEVYCSESAFRLINMDD